MLVLEKHSMIESDRKRTVYNWLQCFSLDTLEAELRECGFVIESVYSDVAGSAYRPETEELAVVATKIQA